MVIADGGDDDDCGDCHTHIGILMVMMIIKTTMIVIYNNCYCNLYQAHVYFSLHIISVNVASVNFN